MKAASLIVAMLLLCGCWPPTGTPTWTPTTMPTKTAMWTPTWTPIDTPSCAPTTPPTETDTPTMTDTIMPTSTKTPTGTATSIPTSTSTMTPTSTPTSAPTPQVMNVWTMMIYAAGDNNLGAYLKRSVEAVEKIPPYPYVQVVGLIDGKIKDDTARFYAPSQRWLVGEQNMGSPQTLRDFVLWAMQIAPAQHYYLAVANHGRATTGICWDETSLNDYLTPTDLRMALDGIHVDVLHLDGCLMASLDNMYDLRDNTDYVIAYENLGWSLFAYDQYLLEAMNRPEPKDLAIAIAQKYFFDPRLDGNPHNVAVIDTMAVRSAWQELNLWEPDLAALKEARKTVQLFDSRDYLKITRSDEYADLGHLWRLMGKDTMALDKAVVLNLWASGPINTTQIDLKNSYGLSIYFPIDKAYTDYNSYVNGRIFAERNAWAAVLIDLYSGAKSLAVPLRPEVPPMLAVEAAP